MFKNALSSVAGAAGVIAILTLISRGFGFVRTVGESWALGATPIADAYSAANNVPNILFEIVAGGALAGVVVPLISGFLVRGQSRDLSQTVSALLTWVLVVSVPVALGVVALSRPIASFILPSGSEATVDLAAFLLTVFAVQVPLYGLSIVATGVLQAHRRFVLPSLAPLLSSLVVIATFALYWNVAGAGAHDPTAVPRGAIALLAWGTTGGVAAFSLLQLLPLLRLTRLRPTLRFPAGIARRAASMAGAGFGGLLAQQAAIVATMVVANSAGGEGTFPIFKYAQAIYFLPYAILSVPIATALYPRISERAAADNPVGLGSLVAGSIRAIIAVSAIGGAVLVAAAPQVTIVFSRVYNMVELTDTLTVLAVGVIGYSLLYHCNRVLFATGNPGGALGVTVAGWSAVIVGTIAVLLSASTRHETLLGLAGSMAVGMTVAGVAGVVACRGAIGPEASSGVLRTTGVSVAAAIVGATAGRKAGLLALDYMGSSLWAAIGAGILAVIGAAALPLLAIYLADRRTWLVHNWVHPN